MQNIIISILIIFSLLLSSCSAYKTGEVIRFNKQSKHISPDRTREFNSDWTLIKSKFSPRFKIDKTITLSSLTSAKLDENSIFKIKFQIDSFETFWITAADRNGIYLNHIEFTFTYSNDKIIDIKWIPDYNDEPEHQGKKPEHIYLIYKWEELNDKDLSTSLLLLFSFGIVTSGFIVSLLSIQFSLFGGSTSPKQNISILPTTIDRSQEFIPKVYNYNQINTFNSNNNNNNNNNNSNSPPPTRGKIEQYNDNEIEQFVEI
ncbi:hypothetical protein DLAC_09299 [Tieghemostelium lacteum]|uniref:Uncharacterized protein n=1 Tax=Tieghemostelium lacteum TaxID=361077 RepID=A0A151Z9X8_TIELA|nr:hypothetical protein DLAC_09299 [Tieghemostelium lacteum]|eukprot:KYQ90664.1 hypothetical protein DLAC_09299 [Tieghemostelium lacteum]